MNIMVRDIINDTPSISSKDCPSRRKTQEVMRVSSAACGWMDREAAVHIRITAQTDLKMT